MTTKRYRRLTSSQLTELLSLLEGITKWHITINIRGEN